MSKKRKMVRRATPNIGVASRALHARRAAVKPETVTELVKEERAMSFSLWAWIIANGDKLFTFTTGVLTIFATPQIASSLKIDETVLAWLAVSSAIIALAHTVFVSSAQQQAAVARLSAGGKP